MSIAGWEQMADWWDQELGDDGDLWHRALIDPPLLRLIGDVNGIAVLDLACGNGYLSRRLAREGATVTAIDANAPIIARAIAREKQEPLGIDYHIVNAANMELFADSRFDLVFCNMALMDIEDATAAIQEVARVLRPRGRFVASFSHPCFDKAITSAWEIEYIYPETTIWRKISNYRELAVGEIPWYTAPDQIINTRSYHRPLSWYFRTFRASGLVVASLEEPEPTEELLANSKQGPWLAQIPLHCVIEAWKLSR